MTRRKTVYRCIGEYEMPDGGCDSIDEEIVIEYEDRDVSDYFAEWYKIDKEKFWDAVSDLELEDELYEAAMNDDWFEDWLKERYL